MLYRFVKREIVRYHYQRKYILNTVNNEKIVHNPFMCDKCCEVCPFQIYWCEKKQCNMVKNYIHF